MKEQNQINELANELYIILQDYENWKVTPENIIKWINQFERFGANYEDKVIILKNLIKFFRITYFSKNRIINLLRELNKKYERQLKEISFLDIQNLRADKNEYSPSESQKNLINLFKDINPDIIINDFSKSKFIYLDDYLLSGGSLKRDIEVLEKLGIDLKKVELQYLCILFNSWNEKAFEKIKNLLYNFGNFNCVICLHSYWEYLKLNNSNEFEKITFENDVDNSNLVKDLFFKANDYIIKNISYNKEYWDNKKKSMLITATFKNIPNNAPICLWWGDERKNNYWLPLLKRKTNKSQYEEENLKDISEWLSNLQFK